MNEAEITKQKITDALDAAHRAIRNEDFDGMCAAIFTAHDIVSPLKEQDDARNACARAEAAAYGDEPITNHEEHVLKLITGLMLEIPALGPISFTLGGKQHHVCREGRTFRLEIESGRGWDKFTLPISVALPFGGEPPADGFTDEIPF